MNHWNPLEHQLRGWKPRRPSAGLRERLFPASGGGVGVGVGVVESPSAFGGGWAWLAPVMGCFLIVMVLSGSRTAQLGYAGAAVNTNWLEAVARNQGYASYAAAGFHSEQNSLQKDPIEWTNTPRMSGEVKSFPLNKTNSLNN